MNENERLSRQVTNEGYPGSWIDLKPKCGDCKFKTTRTEVVKGKKTRIVACVRDNFEILGGIGCVDYRENLVTRIRRWFS